MWRVPDSNGNLRVPDSDDIGRFVALAINEGRLLDLSPNVDFRRSS
jgi:hypothetical protein